MIKILFTVYDTKSQVFGTPFACTNSMVALRSFGAAANDPNSEISQFPSDFILYELGHFDDSSGLFSILPERLYLGNAIQFIETVKIPSPEV